MQNPVDSTPDRNQTVVVMTAGGANPQLLINALAPLYPKLTVIEEQPESKGLILRRRARRLGWLQAIGQLGTMIASRLGKTMSQTRATEIMADYGVSDRSNAMVPIVHVTSLNDDSCRQAVARLQPAVIVTVSCRILSKPMLASLPCPVINLHAGINPGYRGQMGAYWSRVENDEANFGATVHLVDAGIDTGGTLYEQRLVPGSKDTMLTYPLLLTAASTGIVIRAVDDALAGRLAPYAPAGISKLRYPPAVWTWLWNGLTRRIW